MNTYVKDVNTMKLEELKEAMPVIGEFIGDLCEAFGEEMIMGQVSKGLGGEPTFFAVEAGKRAGTRNTVHTSAIHYDQFGIARAVDADWMNEARAFAARRGVEIQQHDPSIPGDIEREAQELRALVASARAKK